MTLAGLLSTHILKLHNCGSYDILLTQSHPSHILGRIILTHGSKGGQWREIYAGA